MSIVQTNLPAFVEQPERRLTTSATGKLDQMTSIYLGPASLAFRGPGGYIPSYGQAHPQYATMFCVSAQVTDKQGSLAEITANYSGRITTNGLSRFVSETLTSVSESEKELSYQVFYQTRLGSGTGVGVQGQGGSIIYQWKIGTNSFVHHYFTFDATYKYVANFRPTAPNFTGSLTSIYKQYDWWAGRGAGDVVIGSALGPDPSSLTWWQSQNNAPLGYQGLFQRCTSIKADNIIGPWYDCTETWELRYEVGVTS